jgi:hypothetical protein
MTSMPRFALAASTVLAGIALAGCASSTGGQAGAPANGSAPARSGSGTAAAPSATPATPGGPMATASATTAGSASGGSASGGSASTECDAGQLRIAYTDNSQILNGALDGMSHVDHVVTFTNEGSASCRTQGYPGIAALNAAGAQIQQAARASGTAPLIVLAPGQTASALVSANSASCNAPTSVPGLLVTAPDQRTSTRLGFAGTFCLGSLTVSTLKPGNAAGLNLG